VNGDNSANRFRLRCGKSDELDVETGILRETGQPAQVAEAWLAKEQNPLIGYVKVSRATRENASKNVGFEGRAAASFLQNGAHTT